MCTVVQTRTSRGPEANVVHHHQFCPSMSKYLDMSIKVEARDTGKVPHGRLNEHDNTQMSGPNGTRQESRQQ